MCLFWWVGGVEFCGCVVGFVLNGRYSVQAEMGGFLFWLASSAGLNCAAMHSVLDSRMSEYRFCKVLYAFPKFHFHFHP